MSNNITHGVLCFFYFFIIFFLLALDLVLCVRVPVVVFVFPGHEHGWFRVQVGHDELLVVCVFGFSLGVVCCSPYPAVCTIQFLPQPNWAKGYCRHSCCPGVCQLLVSVNFEENALSD